VSRPAKNFIDEKFGLIGALKQLKKNIVWENLETIRFQNLVY